MGQILENAGCSRGTVRDGNGISGGEGNVYPGEGGVVGTTKARFRNVGA